MTAKNETMPVGWDRKQDQTAYLDALLPLLAGAQRTVDVLLFKMSSSGRVATDAVTRAKLEAVGIEVRFDDPDVVADVFVRSRELAQALEGR